MRLGSLFAGIGGFDLGFECHGFETRWQVEIDPRCQRVLKERFPHAKRFGDITTVDPSDLEPVDVITFGSPCQDLSVAGRRAGLAGSRSNLFYEATRIIGHLQPRFAIWENVPNALSINEGRDFAAVIAALADCGALDIAWRVLDAQWFGVAQKRRRLFVVADFGGECASEILALADSLRGDSPPRRTAGQGTAPGTEGGTGGRRGFAPDVSGPLVASGRGTERVGESRGQDTVVAFGISENQRAEVLLSDVARSVTSGGGKPGQGYPAVLAIGGDVTHALTSEGHGASEDGTGRGTPIIAFNWQSGGEPRYGVSESHTTALGTSQTPAVLAFTCKDSGQDAGDVAPTLRAMPHDTSHANGGGQVAVAAWQCNGTNVNEIGTLRSGNGHLTGGVPFITGMTVRRLTPRECERLQGFPDDWTLLDPPQSDSARYRQLGNAVAVPVAAWLGKQIMEATHGHHDDE